MKTAYAKDAMENTLGNGLLHVHSERSVAITAAAVEKAVRNRGLMVVAKVDHARAAADAGLKMPPTQLIILGNPAAGTPLMLAAPTTAIDLPLKILIWADASGVVRLTYNDPAFLQQRHGFPEGLVSKIDGVGLICEEVVRFQDTKRPRPSDLPGSLQPPTATQRSSARQ